MKLAQRLHTLADSHLFAGAVAVLVGAVVAVQSRINGAFGREIGDGVVAALVSFGVGLMFVLAIVAGSPWARAGIRKVMVALRAEPPARDLRWWQLVGGLGGALYVAAQGVTVSALGVALFTVCIVAGQTGSSLVVDRLGLGAGGVRRVTALRVVAAVLAVLAVGVGVGDRLDAGSFRVSFVLLVVIAGTGAAFQQAFNGQVARVSQSPVVSSLVNFSVGFVALLAMVLVVRLVVGGGLPSLPSPWSGSWWFYAAGPMGVAYTLGLALVVRTLGVLVFGLCTIAGQLTGATLLDILVPTRGASVTWQLIGAVLLTFVAVALAGVSGSRAATAAAVKESAP